MAHTDRKQGLRLVAGGRSPLCDQFEVELAVWASEAGGEPASAALGDHLATCSACQAEAAALRELVAEVRCEAQAAPPVLTEADWLAMHDAVLLEVARLPAPHRSWWRRPSSRWAWLAVAAAVLATVSTVVWRGSGRHAATHERDVLGSAREVVAGDRAFIDDLTASDEDPLNTLDLIDDLDDVDLDALGTALDDESAAPQGA